MVDRKLLRSFFIIQSSERVRKLLHWCRSPLLLPHFLGNFKGISTQSYRLQVDGQLFQVCWIWFSRAFGGIWSHTLQGGGGSCRNHIPWVLGQTKLRTQCSLIKDQRFLMIWSQTPRAIKTRTCTNEAEQVNWRLPHPAPGSNESVDPE